MYKIQIGFEKGFYVAYLVHQNKYNFMTNIIDEISDTELEELINDIPDAWKTLLTNFLGN